MSKQTVAVPKKRRGFMELMKRREGQRGLVIVLFMAVPLLPVLSFFFIPFAKSVQVRFYYMKDN